MQTMSQAAAAAACKQATAAAATAVAASIEEGDVICISESDSEAVETSMDVDGADSADQERKADLQLPKRRVKAPQRFTPVKAKSGKRHFTYYENPYKKSYIKPTPSKHKQPAGSKRSKPSAFAPLSATPAPATPAADVPGTAAVAAAAAEAPDGLAVALGLQVATQYSQLLQQVQALLDSLHPSQVTSVLCASAAGTYLQPQTHSQTAARCTEAFLQVALRRVSLVCLLNTAVLTTNSTPAHLLCDLACAPHSSTP
jgi:hypothetical protein